MTNRRSQGLTLIELLVVTIIVAVLGSLAYPSYLAHVVKSKRAEARTALTELLQQQERYLAQRGTYLTFATNASVPFKTFTGDRPAGSSYLLAASVCDGGVGLRLCVRVTAEPQYQDPQGGVLWAESTGAKGCSGTQPDVCWK